MLVFVLSALLMGQSQDSADDIVVTARPQGCKTSLADKTLSDGELDARAKDWAAGKPVRVIARATADVKCLQKIAFKLADKGVKHIEFVDPAGRPAQPFKTDGVPVQDSRPVSDPDGSEVRDRERGFLARRAAKMILDGNCAQAKQIALEAGDLDTAAKVVQICQR